MTVHTAGLREHALRLAEPRLAKSPELAAAARKLADDPDPQVRFQAAIVLGELAGDDTVRDLAPPACNGTPPTRGCGWRWSARPRTGTRTRSSTSCSVNQSSPRPTTGSAMLRLLAPRSGRGPSPGAGSPSSSGSATELPRERPAGGASSAWATACSGPARRSATADDRSPARRAELFARCFSRPCVDGRLGQGRPGGPARERAGLLVHVQFADEQAGVRQPCSTRAGPGAATGRDPGPAAGARRRGAGHAASALEGLHAGRPRRGADHPDRPGRLGAGAARRRRQARPSPRPTSGPSRGPSSSPTATRRSGPAPPSCSARPRPPPGADVIDPLQAGPATRRATRPAGWPCFRRECASPATTRAASGIRRPGHRRHRHPHPGRPADRHPRPEPRGRSRAT